MRCFVVLAFIAGSLQAQEPVKPGVSVTPPKLIHSVDPRMPHRFFNGKTHVEVRLLVDAQGLPQQVEVVRSGGKKYDESAVAAVKEYGFAPALKEGVPVPVQLYVEVNFVYR